ncbi:MAG: tetratricopeptide repeat protein [Pseudomonadota bacterium]|nr:tetratricopeptide repeat protein [Pseudomonadota bacterium]
MSDIFQEVDEEVRRDKAVEFWTRHQNAILALAIAIVLATAGYRFWQYRETQAREAAGAAFQTALRLDASGKPDEARAALGKLQQEAPRGYANLSRFVEAGLTLKKDPKAGVTAYDALAADASLDPLLRDTAKLRAALARLNIGETDAARAALDQLAGAGPYRSTAALTLASLAIAAKDWPGAGKWLAQVLGDAQAPQADRQTAQGLLGLVASQSPKP